MAALVLVVAPARAGNEDELFVGNRAAMVGGAVAATVSDASATYYNPAGLAATDRDGIDASASGYSVRSLVAPGFLVATDGTRKDAHVTEFVAVPTQVAYQRRLGEGLSLGLGYFVPRASELLLREHLDAPAAGGSSQWALDARASTADYRLAAALGGRVGRRLRLGTSLFGTYEQTTQSVALFGAVSRGGAATRAVHVDELDTQSVLGAELVAGAQLDVSDTVTLAATARSPRVQLRGSGEASLNTTIAIADSTPPTVVASSADVPVTDGGVRLSRLGRYGAGASVRLGAARVAVEADVQPALRNTRLGVDRRFAWNARAGVEYPLGDAVLLGAGVFTDRAAEGQGSGLVTAAGDFYGGTLGVELADLHRLATGERAESLVFSSVFALRYAHADLDTSGLRVAPDAADLALFGQVPGTMQVDEIGLHVGSALHF